MNDEVPDIRFLQSDTCDLSKLGIKRNAKKPGELTMDKGGMHADTWASLGPFSLGSDASESLRRAGPQKARPGMECRVTIASRHNASTRPAGTALRACSRRGGASCAQARTPESALSAEELETTTSSTRMTPASVQPAERVVTAVVSRDATVKGCWLPAVVATPCAAPRGLKRSMMHARPPP